jgi:predicted aconitase with swiveling domain
MWYRLVDPATGNILTEAKEITGEDLTNNLVSYISPAMPAGSKVLLEISLNNQDW